MSASRKQNFTSIYPRDRPQWLLRSIFILGLGQVHRALAHLPFQARLDSSSFSVPLPPLLHLELRDPQAMASAMEYPAFQTLGKYLAGGLAEALSIPTRKNAEIVHVKQGDIVH